MGARGDDLRRAACRPGGTAVGAVLAVLCGLPSCDRGPASGETAALDFTSKEFRPLPGYAPMEVPADNPMTREKVELGHQLFFDERLSGDGSRSCYSCHLNEKGLSDGLKTAVGAFGKQLTRNSPTLWNIGFHQEFYWDGRAGSLESQAYKAWTGANMGAKDEESVAKINAIPGYADAFQEVFQGPATKDNVTQALAAYMRTIISRSTPFDRFQAGDESAISEAAKRGYEVFQKAKCDNCHSGKLFTDQLYHNVGIGMESESPDPGRFAVTQVERDTGAFKTPTLRDVADSGPYFHDGSAARLEEAVGIMVTGGVENPYLDRENLKPADISMDEMRDLLEFLKALDEPTTLARPRLP